MSFDAWHKDLMVNLIWWHTHSIVESNTSEWLFEMTNKKVSYSSRILFKGSQHDTVSIKGLIFSQHATVNLLPLSMLRCSQVNNTSLEKKYY